MTETIRRLANALTPYINQAIADPEEAAHVVLEAIRSADKPMKRAGLKAFEAALHHPGADWERGVEIIWLSMVDEALGKGSTS